MDNNPKNRTAWFTLVEEFEQSNLTQINFCKQKGLILSRFTYYVQLYRQINTSSKQKAPTFSPVLVSSSTPSVATDIKIELPNGFRC
jgi:hypothetical protein